MRPFGTQKKIVNFEQFHIADFLSPKVRVHCAVSYGPIFLKIIWLSSG